MLKNQGHLVDFWRFLENGHALGDQIHGMYNPLLVLVPLGLGALTGFTLFSVLQRMVVYRHSRHFYSWLLPGAFAAGGGLWAMNLTGMLAYTLPFEVDYKVAISLSMLPAMLGSGLAMVCVGGIKPQIWSLRLHLGALFFGAAFCSMHYMGMEAMHMPALLRYDFAAFCISLIAAYFLALACLFLYLILVQMQRLPAVVAPLVSGAAVGLAVLAMHYMATSAVVLYAKPSALGAYQQMPHVLPASTLVAFTILILVLTILAAWADSLEKLMEQQSKTDPITGLPNRHALNEHLYELMAQNPKRPTRIDMFLVGLDAFTQINASLGHAAGDGVLKEIAARLKAKFKDKYFVARFGGDEFAIVLTGESRSQATLIDYAEQLIKTVDLPLTAGGLRLYLRASVGLHSYAGEEVHPEVLIDHAHSAMRAAKSDKKSYRFYSKDLGDYAREQIWMRAELHKALNNEKLELQYQPQVELATRKMIGVEALARWHHPKKGWISPQDFIPVIESIGVELELDAFVLEAACLQAKRWLDANVNFGRIAVNLSPGFLEQADAVKKISAVLERVGLPGERLQLEVLESRLLNYEYIVQQRFIAIKNMGVTIAIDDFGTGYSSLSYLRDLPVDCMKLDQSFVKKLSDQSKSKAIPIAVQGMAKGLGLCLVAEGVETEEQRRMLMDLDYQYGQGFLFSQPLPGDEINEYFLSHGGVHI
ncbi:MAG: EAL domain-containing protein [Salinisphaeraceae bacterium]|nr:EAL domain-containing protein [Salinisphaeraceae bacterium]